MLHQLHSDVTDIKAVVEDLKLGAMRNHTNFGVYNDDQWCSLDCNTWQALGFEGDLGGTSRTEMRAEAVPYQPQEPEVGRSYLSRDFMLSFRPKVEDCVDEPCEISHLTCCLNEFVVDGKALRNSENLLATTGREEDSGNGEPVMHPVMDLTSNDTDRLLGTAAVFGDDAKFWKHSAMENRAVADETITMAGYGGSLG